MAAVKSFDSVVLMENSESVKICCCCGSRSDETNKELMFHKVPEKGKYYFTYKWLVPAGPGGSNKTSCVLRDRFELWVERLKLEKTQISGSEIVCSTHFSPSNYEIYKDTDEKLVMRLATSALPLIWQQSPSTVEQHRAEGAPASDNNFIRSCCICKTRSCANERLFHKFPPAQTHFICSPTEDVDVRDLWIKNSQSHGDGFICSAHFGLSDYQVTGTQGIYKMTLKPEAIPSLLLPDQPTSQDNSVVAKDPKANQSSISLPSISPGNFETVMLSNFVTVKQEKVDLEEFSEVNLNLVKTEPNSDIPDAQNSADYSETDDPLQHLAEEEGEEEEMQQIYVDETDTLVEEQGIKLTREITKFDALKTISKEMQKKRRKRNQIAHQITTCIICKAKFDTCGEMWTHFKEEYGRIATDPKLMDKYRKREALGCALCRRTFECRVSMWKHVNGTHAPHIIHVCLVCEKVVESNQMLMEHMKQVHNYCVSCCIAFPDPSELVEHEASHQRGEVWLYKCGDCKNETRTLDHMKHHWRNYHKSNSAEFERISREVPRPKNWLNHCPYCGAYNSGLWVLRSHIALHQVASCTECGRQHISLACQMFSEKCTLCALKGDSGGAQQVLQPTESYDDLEEVPDDSFLGELLLGKKATSAAGTDDWSKVPMIDVTHTVMDTLGRQKCKRRTQDTSMSRAKKRKMLDELPDNCRLRDIILASMNQ